MNIIAITLGSLRYGGRSTVMHVTCRSVLVTLLEWRIIGYGYVHVIKLLIELYRCRSLKKRISCIKLIAIFTSTSIIRSRRKEIPSVIR